ncbi:DUF2098 domain-containing protein [Methanobrevibacter sp.]|uniref:DUF2098 domain-containing protein n=1 Tax=Methanobrevibacter sp. TaxID=66852 RepID=UPI0026DFF639|nr:DUF2098 family protein [Methanobrevibacter sp.]MDO5823683.1 DUF2098 family protein [Methanobrevibacter sp.]
MALDARNMQISLDSHVRYVDTGTLGQVIDEKITDGVEWVKLDKTGLWYQSNRVELLGEKDIKKGSWADGKKVDVEDLKDKALNFEELELSSDACNGGG